MLTINTITAAAPPPATGPVATAYARQARRCGALVKRLDAALWDHGFAAGAEPANQGFVVELAVLEHALAQALAYAMGMDADDVERMLADLPTDG
jgi:hypothetical protein